MNLIEKNEERERRKKEEGKERRCSLWRRRDGK